MGRSPSRVVSILAFAAFLGGVSTTAAMHATQAAAAVTRPAKPLSPNPSSTSNVLSGVSAAAATDAWAVGRYVNDTTGATDTLILHWDGSTWSKVKSPNPGTGPVLLGVSAVSSSDAWAVGYYSNDTTGAYDTLILHWNGTTWSKVTSPNPSSNSNFLGAVSAVSATDAWAVGQYKNTYATLVLHWDGTKWSKVASPNPSSSGNVLSGVSAVSSSDAWAVGDYLDDTTGATDTLILHWNGTKWSKEASPNPSSIRNFLGGVSADSATDAWAVGYFCADCETGQKTLILRRNGTSWSKVKSPNPAITNTLFGVSAVSDADVWAVGSNQDSTTFAHRTLILHWNGTKWSKVASPNPSSSGNYLGGVSAVSATDALAVGDYLNGTTGADDTLALHWNGTSWSKT